MDLILKKKEDSKEFFFKIFKSDYLNQSIRSFGNKKYFDNLRAFASKSKNQITEKIILNIFRIINFINTTD